MENVEMLHRPLGEAWWYGGGDEMRMSRLSFFLTAIWMMAASAAGAADSGRYQIVSGPPTILLDTTTGRTWRYEPPGRWQPLEIVKLKAVETKTKERIHQRWKREVEKTRLPLNPSGQVPAKQKPARKLLDELLLPQ